MKTLTIAMMAFILTTTMYAQGIRPGVWRYTRDQNAIKITIDGDNMGFKAWREEFSLTKVSDTKFEDTKYGYTLELFHPDSMYLRNEKYKVNDKVYLYSPDNHTNKDTRLVSYVWNGDTYYTTALRSREFAGEYLYKNGSTWGEPTIQLNTDGTGHFQRHDVAPDAIKWWGIETSYKGVVPKITGTVNRNYKTIVTWQYADGTFDRKELIVMPDDGKSIILGERVYVWK